jgi:acetyl-CoA carboxylase/biotin carboxylase 1
MESKLREDQYNRLYKLKRILIANNGLAAVKFIISIREFSRETLLDENFFTFVLMASDDDLCANSAYLSLGSEILNVPSGPSQNNYGNVNLIAEICRTKNIQVLQSLQIGSLGGLGARI